MVTAAWFGDALTIVVCCSLPTRGFTGPSCTSGTGGYTVYVYTQYTMLYIPVRTNV